jgi:hypothetical protein
MATYSAKGSKEFDKVPEGTHLAVCTLVADVGLQPGSGMFPDPKVKVYMRFEIPSERITYEKDGVAKEGPAIIYNNYTATMGAKANLRKAVQSWRGKPFANDGEAELFDIRKLLGQTCMLQVVHSPDGKYANVSNVMAPPRGTAKLTPEGVAVYYGPDDDKQYDALPKFLRDKVDTQLDPSANAKKAADSTPVADRGKPRTGEDRFADNEGQRQADDGEPFNDPLNF